MLAFWRRLLWRMAAAAESAKREPHAGPRSSAAPGSGALTWSVEKPKRRGWWWVEWYNGDVRPIEVIDTDTGGLVAQTGNGSRYYLGDPFFKRWAGPLVKPLEAPDAEPLPNDGADRSEPASKTLTGGA